jgi:hypothetical protein
MIIDKGIKEIEIYIDEIDSSKDFNYLVFGALYVDTSIKADVVQKLLNFRCKNSENKYWKKIPEECKFFPDCKVKGYHNLNSKEIHFYDLSNSTSKSHINTCKDWINYFKTSNVFFNMLILDLDKLNLGLFGDDEQKMNAFTRFFRTLIDYGTKSFFNNHQVCIKNIYYDESDAFKSHNYFPKRNIEKMNEMLRKLDFNCEKIDFIDSSHNHSGKYDESNLIQLADLLLGVTKQVIFNTAKDSKTKINLALEILPLLNQLKEKRTSVKNFRISIFPKRDLKYLTDLEGSEIRDAGNFKSLEDIDFEMKDPRNKSLKDFF